MINDCLRAFIDQQNTLTGETLPFLWGSLFRNCLEQGLTAEQALTLVKTFIVANSGGSKTFVL